MGLVLALENGVPQFSSDMTVESEEASEPGHRVRGCHRWRRRSPELPRDAPTLVRDAGCSGSGGVHDQRRQGHAGALGVRQRGRQSFGGSSPTRPSTASRSRSACPV